LTPGPRFARIPFPPTSFDLPMQKERPMTKRILVSITGAFVLGCTPHIHLRVLEPADVAVPPHIEKVAVVSRTRPSTGGQAVLNVIEGALSGEAIGADREGAAQAKRGVVEALAESPRYDVVVPAVELEGVGSGVTAPPLRWPRVEKICAEVGAQGLVVLEAFDTNSSVEEQVENRTRTDDRGKEIHYKVFHAHRETSMISTWRFYDAGNHVLIDEWFDHRNARSWEEEGETPEDARSRLPAQIDTVGAVAWDAGHDYGRRIAPSWLWVSRAYFGKGDPAFKEAKRHVRADQWVQAEAAWGGLAQSEDPKIRGRALFNLALVKEREGDLDQAVALAREADSLLGKGRTRGYISTLETRRAKQAQLEQQLRTHAPPPPPEEPPIEPPAEDLGGEDRE
jgi:hypothetical protein